MNSVTSAIEKDVARRTGPIIFAMTGAAGSAGGIATANLNVLQVLNAMSIQSRRRLIVLSLHERDDDRPDFLANNVVFVGFQGNRLAYGLWLLYSLRRECLYLFDHIRLSTPLIPIVFFGFRNFVVLAHGSESWKRVRGTSKWLFRRARMCLTNSQFTLDRMCETFSGFAGKSCVLGLSPFHNEGPNGTGGATEAMNFEAVDGTIRVLSDRVILLVGRMDSCEREKGHRELLEIWAEVLDDHHDAQLVFAGPGSDRLALVALASDLQISASVFIPGYLSTEVLRRLYRKCFAFVMPSRQEGFGLAYLEAMNSGKPCVGCRHGGGEEIIEDEITGLLLKNPYESGELLRAVRRLLGDEVLTKRLGEGGFRRLQDRFTSRHAQERLRQILMELI
jgi:glycosyltransferase involved in cell wall biosynthesis